jgi:hypothetical protein
MIVLNFIIGLIVIATPILAMYGIGRFITKRHTNLDFFEIMLAGLVGIVLIVLACLLLKCMYHVGSSITHKIDLM